MTGTQQVALTIDRRVSTRLVQPGSWSPCAQCRGAIEYVPGGRRFLVSIASYKNDALQQVELFHTACYVETA